MRKNPGNHEIPDRAAPLMPNADYASVVKLGLWILTIGFGGFLAWAFLAPLDEGIPAAGTVTVESSRKRIDHPGGGIIEKILVTEGQLIRAGEPLLILNEIQSKSALEATTNQYYAAVAKFARLRAERERATVIAFPEELINAGGPETSDILRTQDELFRFRRTAQEGELRIIDESVRGLELQLRSLDALKSGHDKQIALFKIQLESYQKLNRDGFVSRNYLLEFERQLSEIQSKLSEDLANIASVNARLAEFRLRGAQRELEFRRDVEEQLADTQREVATLRERLTGQRDIQERQIIRAPVSGRIVDLSFHTIGGVVKPGDRIMDIVPQEDELIIEARVAPQYIDRLHVGLLADVHFDAYAKLMNRPLITGQIEVLSADTLTDPQTRQPYYTIRVSVPESEIRKLGEVQLLPGMLATVMVKTGERSLAAYLVRPLLRRFTSAMKE